MRVVELKAENIKRVVAVDIRVGEDEDVVVVSGKNMAGKSSVLDSIWYALGGGNALPSKPVREGEERGSIRLDLGKLVVEREFTSDGKSRLRVFENKPDGEPVSLYLKPQTVLDSLLSERTFDPLVFARQDRKGQRETLLAAMGVSVDDLDEQRKELLAERVIVGRQGKAAKARAEAAPNPKEELPDELIDVSEMREQITASKVAASEQQRLAERAESISSRCEELAQEVEALRKKADSLEQTRRDLRTTEAELRSQIGALEIPDVSKLEEQIQEASRTNDQILLRQEFLKLLSSTRELRERYEDLTAKIAEVDAKKERRLSEAGFPIEGLGLDDEGVTFRGLPFDQLSSAEQLRVSMATAMAANPKLRVIRVTDGSLLDGASMSIIREMAREGDWQVWVERVDESGEVGIYIEDGQVAADNRREAEQDA